MKLIKNIVALSLALGLSMQLSQAQICTAKVLMTVGEDPVTTGDFLRVYKKNNKNAEMTEAGLREYLDLYVKFRLKVKEAKTLKLDTNQVFIKELAGYRTQLAQPYMIDSATMEKLILEAYERAQIDIRASHILIKLAQNPSPKDTLDAYNKCLKIRKEFLAGAKFEDLATKYSEDPSAQDRFNKQANRNIPGNKGDLGYFTTMDMVYPFESAAYALPVGEISMPVRTEFGYHLIKIVDKKPAMGTVQVAHIFVMQPMGTVSDSVDKQLKFKINEAYNRLNKGEAWDSIVLKYSDDKMTASRGGVIKWFGVQKMVPEFIETIYTLKNLGDYSAPIHTAYGYHIIKLIARKNIGPLAELQNDYKSKISSKADRFKINKEALVKKAIKEYGFIENATALKAFYPLIDSSIHKGEWSVEKAKKLTGTIFTIGTKNVNQQDFAKHIQKNQFISKESNYTSYINEQYIQFKQEIIINYFNDNLELNYPDFAALMQEYKDGMLLFELTDKMVWSKAIKDSAGLANFHENNKQKYMWGQRVQATLYTCSDAKIAAKARKMALKGATIASIKNKLDPEKLGLIATDSAAYSKGDHTLIDAIAWQQGASEISTKENKSTFVVIHKVLDPMPKDLKDCKGLVTSDYQNKLEEEWIKELKSKYPVTIDDTCFAELYK